MTATVLGYISQLLCSSANLVREAHHRATAQDPSQWMTATSMARASNPFWHALDHARKLGRKDKEKEAEDASDHLPCNASARMCYPSGTEDNISSIPHELLLHLLNFIIYPDILSLRLTSLLFHSLVPITDFPKHHTATVPIIYGQEITCHGDENAGLHQGPLAVPWMGRPNPHLRHAPIHVNLPCYNCFQWFSLGHFTKRLHSDGYVLAGRLARNRICMECGVRTGRYRKGGSVGHTASVCLDCGKLYWIKYEFTEERWKFERYCRVCAPTNGVYVWKWQKHLGEKRLARYLEYLRKMKLGKQYRMTKGEELRRERGVGTKIGDTMSTEGLQHAKAADVLVPVISVSKIDGKYCQHYLTYWCCLVTPRRQKECAEMEENKGFMQGPHSLGLLQTKLNHVLSLVTPDSIS